MPRGNLEVIHPRSLTLKIVVRLLETGENYGKAMEILRRQRINQNIVVDNNPALFIANVRKFLQQVLLHCQSSKKIHANHLDKTLLCFCVGDRCPPAVAVYRRPD